MTKNHRALMPDVIAGLRDKLADHVSDDLPRREAGYTITNVADEVVVRIYDEIWEFGVNAADLARDLDAVTASRIRVEINSPGGSVWDGIAIYNALRSHPAEVTTRVDGIAASIASVIAQAGDHRVIVGGGQMMIHNASGLAVGDTRTHTEMAELLAQQDEVIAGIYASRSQRDAGVFREMMNAETWLTAERAVAEGLADEVLDPSTTKPTDQGRALADRITDLADEVGAVMSDVEELVARHGDAGAVLTAAKRDGLVALRDAGVRAADLLSTDHEDDATSSHEAEIKSLIARQRDAVHRASLPVA